MDVDMAYSTVKESLRADMSAWVFAATESWPMLREIGEELLLMEDPTHLYSPFLVLARILESDRPLVMDVMSILGYCKRTLTIPELAEALAIDSTLTSMTQLGEKRTVDLEFDLCHALSGLIYIEDGLIWFFDSVRDQLLMGIALDWVDMGPNAEMRLALICLKYISVWSEKEENVSASSKHSLRQSWAFLNYAVTFWHHHYSCASQNGAVGDELERLLDYKPGFLRTWLDLQNVFDPLRVIVTDETMLVNATVLSPASIAVKLGIRLQTAISVVDLATQILPRMDGDISSAMTLSNWYFREQHEESSLQAWMERNECHFDSQSLVRAFAYLPETAFDVLLVDPEGIKQNAALLLTTAVRQGNGMVVRKCLPHVTTDRQLLSDLLSISSSLEEGWIPVLGALSRAERLLLTDDQKSQIAKSLFCGAVKYKQLQLVDVLLNYGPEFTQPDLTRILCAATEAGQIETVRRMTETLMSIPIISTSGIDTPLHRASVHNFLGIANILLAGGASVSAKGTIDDTPLHKAASYGHIDMVQLLLEANRKAISESTSASSNKSHDGGDFGGAAKDERFNNILSGGDNALEAENGGGHLPLALAIISQNETVVSLILENTPRSAVLSKMHIQLATGCLNRGVLQLLLESFDFDLNLTNEESALKIACRMSSPDLVKVLLEMGAEPWPSDVAIDDLPFNQLRFERFESNKDIAEMLTSKCHKPKKSVLNETLLHVAYDGDEMLMTTLLDAGADKNTRYPSSKCTPLHICAYNGFEAAARLLLMRGADPSVLDDSGDSPLVDATDQRHPSIIRLLLERGERYSLESANHSILKLTEWGDLETLELTLKFQEEFRGTRVLARCFHIALRNNNEELLSLLLEYDADANFESGNRHHGNAIHECAYYGNLKMARFLLDHPGGIEGNKVDSLAGGYHTPLIAAVSWQYQESNKKKQVHRRLMKQRKMVKFLMERQGDPKIKGGVFGTMLNAAAASSEPELVTYVLDEVGFKVDEVDHEGRCAAHLASSSRNLQDTHNTLELLCKRADSSDLLWRADKHGRLPLHFACGGQRLQILWYLLSSTVSKDQIDQVDNDGWTPLHWACRQWDVLLVRYLVQGHGAKTDCSTNDGWTPWDVAVFHGNPDFASALGRKDDETLSNDALKGAGEQWPAVCDSCVCSIYGTRYDCVRCSDYVLCFKCFKRAAEFHGMDHAFKRRETETELEESTEPTRYEVGETTENMLTVETKERLPYSAYAEWESDGEPDTSSILSI